MTLPEILTAVAILSILFALLIVPVMKAFGYIRTSNVRIGVQSTARSVFESMSREISDAVYVYDNCDDPTSSSLIIVLAQGAGVNANQAAANGAAVPIFLNPGPGLEYGVRTPVHVHYQIALARALERQPDGSLAPVSYWNQWEMENPDLRGGGLNEIAGQARPRSDNPYRIVRAEYYPSAQDLTTDPVQAEAQRFLLQSVLTDFDVNRPDMFREPGWLIDESLHPRNPTDARNGTAGTPALCNSAEVAGRRKRLEDSGILTPLTPREDVDAAWVSYVPPAPSAPAGTKGSWSAKPLVKFEAMAVSNESLDPVSMPGASYPSTYRADYGHWQWKRRQAWSHPSYKTAGELDAWARYFQVFDAVVHVRYAGARRAYYTSLGRDDSASGVPATAARDDNGDGVPDPHYYVWRLTSGSAEPTTGVWPDTDEPKFDMTRYKSRIERFRQGPGAGDTQAGFWDANNPYDPALLPDMTTDPGEPYWPEMAFLLDVERGSVEFRVDAPVRQPMPDSGGNEAPQPAGPLAPFQAPYGTGAEAVPAPDGNKSDWIIPDVARAAASPNYRNADNTTWIRIAPESMRVMVGQPVDPADLAQGYTWRSYTRVTERTMLSRGEFFFDEVNGILSFDPNEAGTGEWTPNTLIRAWYQIQTNVQRANANWPVNSTNGTSVTASYLTKEVLRLTLGLRGYDSETGRAQPFQLSATIRPRNLR